MTQTTLEGYIIPDGVTASAHDQGEIDNFTGSPTAFNEITEAE